MVRRTEPVRVPRAATAADPSGNFPFSRLRLRLFAVPSPGPQFRVRPAYLPRASRRCSAPLAHRAPPRPFLRARRRFLHSGPGPGGGRPAARPRRARTGAGAFLASSSRGPLRAVPRPPSCALSRDRCRLAPAAGSMAWIRARGSPHRGDRDPCRAPGLGAGGRGSFSSVASRPSGGPSPPFPASLFRRAGRLLLQRFRRLRRLTPPSGPSPFAGRRR